MAEWLFTTPTIAESPFAWNPLMERYRMDRAISLVEVSPCQYEQVRYDAYTNELGALNLPDAHVADPDFWPQPATGLHYFRGGYEWIVDDATKACLISSDVGVTEANFTIAPNQGFGQGGFGEGGFGS